MKWGRVKLLALLLSLMLNAGILLVGLSFYQAQELALSQVAGSQTQQMDFTLEIVASTPSKNASLDLKTAVEDDEDLKSVEDESRKTSLQSMPLADKEYGAVDLIALKEPAIEQVLPKASEVGEISSIDDMLEIEPSLITNPKTELSKPLEARKLEAQKLEERRQVVKTEAERSRNLQARTGDQFASELAVKIHAQIKGCYPESSKRRGEEGVVRLMIAKDQQSLSVMMIESSGFKRLDRCAISAVEKILSSIDIQEVPATGIDLKPIRFQLH